MSVGSRGRRAPGSAIRAGVAIVLVLGAGPPSAKQTLEARYRSIVIAYRADPNPAIERMLEIPDHDVGLVVAAATKRDGWAAADLLTAAMLHTDAGLYFLVRSETPALGHLERAESFLVAAIERSRVNEWFEREWFPIVSKALADAKASDWVATFAARRVARLKVNPPLGYAIGEFGRGVEIERLGGEQREMQTSANSDESRFWLPQAEATFTLALEHDPDLVDAALHLGRIEMLSSREDRAMTLFARAAGSTRPSTVYLAELFAGSIDERHGRFAEAETRYRRAAQVFPRGQAATLALAELLARIDRAAEGSQALDDQLDRGKRGLVLEPWWMYDQRARIMDIRYLRADVSQ